MASSQIQFKPFIDVFFIFQKKPYGSQKQYHLYK